MFAGNQAISIQSKMPFALLSAAFIAQIVPIEELSHIVGPNWLIGYNYKCLLGSSAWGPDDLISNSFNFLAGGAGAPQIVALISGWSIFAIHRVLVFEAPTMMELVTIRLISCALLPILAGLIVELLSIDGLNIPPALAF